MDAYCALPSGDSSHSCGYCKNIVQQLIQPPDPRPYTPPSTRATSKRIDFGCLDSILGNQNCNLCRFIVRIYNATKSCDDQSVVDLRDIHCYTGWEDTLLSRSGKRLDWNLSLTFATPDAGSRPGRIQKRMYPAAFRLHSQDAHLLGLDESVYNLGWDVNPDKCDVDFMRLSYQNCRRIHGAKCEHPSRTFCGKEVKLWTRASLPTSMRFVDVEDDCIRAVTPQPDYVALSYMWGGMPLFKLTKANLRSMETAGSLLSVTLPRTIQDAIGATRALGERYTWIDAICICQDDEDSYIDQVRHMDKIYCNAALTIVAAGADHADAGLPCFRPGSRRHMQVVEEIQGMRLVSAAPELVKVMDRFSYSTRGWTFQEYVFSKRLLVFTPFQVYYSCETECVSEDFRGPRAPREYIEGFELPEGSAQSAGRNFPTHYETAVAAYTHRELTFQADVIPAVFGILNLMSRTFDERFICGTPGSCVFEHGLLWRSGGRLSRRESSSSRRSSNFPSWSWIGWIGPVKFNLGTMLANDPQFVEDVRVITRWSVRLPQSKQRVSVFERFREDRGQAAEVQVGVP